MTTPGMSTGPGESRENLDRRAGETTNHGEQVRWTRNFCENLRTEDNNFGQLVQEYHQKGITKDQLRIEFKKKLRQASPGMRAKIGMITAGAEPSDAEIETFLTDTKCFDNQLMSQIEGDFHARGKARENMIDNCLGVSHDEYGDFDEEELRKSLKKEGNERLRTFLETPKYRKTYIKKLPGSHTLTEKDFGDVNFEEITRAISKLDSTNIQKRKIQEAWLKIAQVAHPEKNLAHAFSRISHKGGPAVNIAGAYSTFFSDKNILISRENREKILNFLTRQYVPVVPFSIVEALDKKTSKTLLTSETEDVQFDRDLPTDRQLASALKKDKKEQWEKTYKSYIGGGTTLIGTRNLPFLTKIRLLSQFGSTGKAEKMREYYHGKPGSLRASTDNEGDFRRKFKTAHDGLDPEKLDTRSGLTEELTARLGHRVEGLENFEPGCVMQWKTKDPETKSDLIGYYIIDTVPTEDIDEDNILTVRFLGNNKGALSLSGLASHYTGADFYDYLDGCTDDGKISFRKNDEFEAEMNKNTKENKFPRYYTAQETQAELQNKFPDTAEVMSLESLDYEVDKVLNPQNDNTKEAKNPESRKLHTGMVFAKIGDRGIDTFQIEDIDDKGQTITLWDGWGSGEKSRQTMSFTEFVNLVKHLKKTAKESGFYRLPTQGKKFGVNEFNELCAFKDHYKEGTAKQMEKAAIREIDGKQTFGKVDPKTGAFVEMPIVKIGPKKDLYIENISGSTVTYRLGTHKKGKFDQEKDKWEQKPEFSGSKPRTMSLEMLWAHLYESGKFDFEKETEKVDRKVEEKENGMSWWNILKHTHSLGVILHGDLWSAPMKAWEEQHHKDHAFAGKITAALAMEKLNSGKGPIGWLTNKFEFPALMVADGNSTFQSYLDELVNKVDNMGSYHRTRLIKKWVSREHFPSPKFMAAIFASMQIFGHLYPYDDGDSDPRAGEWFWWNSICHSLDPNHTNPKKYPHMPPHDGDPWPKILTDSEGNMMSEVQGCNLLFGGFEHPMLKNLGRRFQKYMVGGQDKLKSGAPSNLNERTTMDGKLEWMMSAIVSQKIPEAFGDGTALWLKEGYPTEISTMPYAAALFGCREQQLMSPTQEHIKKQFQDEGIQFPQFVFMQSKSLGDVFRGTSIAFAYTISQKCGEELESIVNETKNHRITSTNRKSWTAKFSAFWRQYGRELMHKLTGMRDPMLNLMINDPQTFNEMLADQPEPQRTRYMKLRENRGVISAYYNRLAETYNSPTHCNLHRDKDGYYDGDHFRFRDDFDSGCPIAWINWDAYLDANLDDKYAAGQLGSTSGDGVFNELRAFLNEIPSMAKKMADEMGFKEDHPKRKYYIDKISKGLFEKNRNGMKRIAEMKIDASNPKAEYCSMSAMMLGIMDVRKLAVGGSDPKFQEIYNDYFIKMQLVRKKAEEMEKEDYAKSITYRVDMANKWRAIIKANISVQDKSIEDIYNAKSVHDLKDSDVNGVIKRTQADSGTVLYQERREFEEKSRRKDIVTNNTDRNSANEAHHLPLGA